MVLLQCKHSEMHLYIIHTLQVQFKQQLKSVVFFSVLDGKCYVYRCPLKYYVYDKGGLFVQI